MSITDFESPSWPLCTLSYRMFHLQWTLPLCLALFLLNRPFLTRLDYAKLTLLPIIAFVWTTPWDNYIVKNHAWFYRRQCVWFTIGYVPIEEYFFFIVQSIVTTLWCSFVTRWHLPNLYTVRSARFSLARPVLAAALACFAAGLWAAQPGSSSYYLGMISWWSALPLGMLLWGTIDFVATMGLWAGTIPFFISVAAPTVYLWFCDIYALRRGTWHINERTSLNIFPIKDLPIEEMVFFVVTNTILVTACFTFDRCVAICRTNASINGTALSPSFLPLNTLSTYKHLWLAFIQSDRPQSVQRFSRSSDDLQISLEVLKKASKSFSAASLLLPWDLRTDLGCLYAFCRVADDLVDDDMLDMTSKVHNLEMVRAVVDAVYEESTHVEATESLRLRLDQILARCTIETSVRASICAAACSISSLTPFIPKRLWLEMLSGYSTDLRFEQSDPALKTRFKGMDELVEYSQCVAGVVGEMCTRLILGRCGVLIDPNLMVDRTIKVPTSTEFSAEKVAELRLLDLTNRDDVHILLYEARRMGVSLQLVNIARDIIPDSVDLGRCYLPLDFFSSEDQTMQTALLEKRVELSSDESERKGVRPEAVRKYALQLLDISKQLYRQSFPALDQIPNGPARAGLRAACSVYAAIGTRIEAQSAVEVATGKRARMSNVDRLGRALSAVYLGS